MHRTILIICSYGIRTESVRTGIFRPYGIRTDSVQARTDPFTGSYGFCTHLERNLYDTPIPLPPPIHL